MASSSSLLSEEQFQCSICLEVFTEPVSIPCGHNFCMACIRKYWEGLDHCQCPMCKRFFDKRPDLSVNRFIAEMATFVKQSAPAERMPCVPDQQYSAKAGEVACDVCTGRKLKAFKSCLECLASYCETHLEPHQRVASFKKHKLIEPVENLEDRVCKTHVRPLEFFCRTDKICLCLFCTEADHKTHKTVPIQEESGEKRKQLWKTKNKVPKMIQDRRQRIKEIEHALEISLIDAQQEVDEGNRVFSVMVCSIERSQAELVEAVEKKLEAKEKQAKGLVKKLELEIYELMRRKVELEELSHSEDLDLLRKSPSLCNLPTTTRDWPEAKMHGDGLCVRTLRRLMSQLEETFGEELEKLYDAELKAMQKFAADVTLDPDTANSKLDLSDDGKQVKLTEDQQHLPDHPKRFDPVACVLGGDGQLSGRVYYEVKVKGKTGWAVGVATESINRKGSITLSPVNGHWTVGLMNEDEYVAHAGPCVPLTLRETPRKVGVFVDYEVGEVSFYDVKARSHMYSFSGCTFTERIYPFFYVGLQNDGRNCSPLIIC